MSTSYLPPHDSQVLHTQDCWLVLARKQEILWPDNSSRWLHSVGKFLHGERQEQMLVHLDLMRAAHVGGTWHIFEIGGLHINLRGQLGDVHPSDQPGFIFYTLRLSLRDANAFDEQVQRIAIPTQPQERLAA